MHSQFAILVFAATIGLTSATLGVDVAVRVSQAQWQCIKNAGYNFAIVRVYRSIGSVDSNAAATIKNARAAGIRYVDGYIFPCKKCGNPRGQVRAALDNLKRNEATIGQLWLDIEGSQYWSSNDGSNVEFIQAMVDEAQSQGIVVAIYTSKSQWAPITGNTNRFKDLQVWYAHYDNKPNFSDFRSFGGWTRPAMKQFVGTTRVCNVVVDKNWYP